VGRRGGSTFSEGQPRSPTEERNGEGAYCKGRVESVKGADTPGKGIEVSKPPGYLDGDSRGGGRRPQKTQGWNRWFFRGTSSSSGGARRQERPLRKESRNQKQRQNETGGPKSARECPDGESEGGFLFFVRDVPLQRLSSGGRHEEEGQSEKH